MGTKQLEIVLMLTAKTKAASDRINSFLSKTDNKFKKLEKTAHGINEAGSRNLLRGAAIAAPLAIAAKSAINLEAAVTDVTKVLPNTVAVGSNAFKALEKGAQTVGYALGRSAEDAAGLMASLAAGGVPEKDLTKIALLAGKIGVAFDVTGLQAGQSFQAIKNAMQLTNEGVMKVMNANNALANSFGSTVDASARLLQFMQDTGASVAASLKTSGSDIQALENSFMTIGISSDEAGTSIDRLSKAILTNKQLASTFNAAGGGTKGIMAIFEAAKKSGNAVQWLLQHGVGQYSTKIGAVINAMDSQKGLKAQLAFVNNDKNVNGSVNQEFASKTATTAFKFKQMKVGALNLATTIGSTLIPTLNKLFNRLTPIAKSVSKWIDTHQKLVEDITVGIAAFAGISLVLGGLQKVIGGSILGVSRLIDSFSKIGKVISVVSKVIAANPWMLAIAAIAAAAYLIYKNWDKISLWFKNMWNGVTRIFMTVVKVIAALLINFTPLGLIYKHWGKISGWFSKVWDAVKGVFSTTWSWIEKMFLDYTPYGLVIKNWSKIVDAFKVIWDKVKDVFKKAMDWIKSSWVGKIIGKLIGGIGGAFTKVKETISYASGHSLGATVKYTNAQANSLGVSTFLDPVSMPKISPVKSGNTINSPFNLTVQLSGTATKADADRISKASHKLWLNHYNKMKHDNKRVSFQGN